MGVSGAKIATLSLKDFRNFAHLEMEVPPDGFVVVGENGHGKTNLLEATYYLSLMRSFRGARDVDVTRFGADGFFIESRICAPDAHVLSVGFERATRRKRVRRDDAIVERLSDALGVLPAVMFSPGDIEIVSGAASARRRFLDIMLSLSSRPYLHALQQYRAALERRNAVLRDALRAGANAPPSSLEVWDGPLAENGAKLVRARRAWIAHVGDRFAERCEAIGERTHIKLQYQTSVAANAESVELALTEALAAKRFADFRSGMTQVGPHRDDVIITLDGRDARSFGSAGQHRTAAIALRMLEAETLRDARDSAPVFLMDDPFAELDARRSSRVLVSLTEIGRGQTILAVPRDGDIPSEFTGLARRRVVAGVLHE